MKDENISEREDLEFDWEENDREIDAALKEMEYWGEQIDESIEWMDLLQSMEGSLLEFKENMESLSLVFPTLESLEVSSNKYLCGVIMVGVVSAYESVVHDLFSTVIGKSSNSESAINQIHNLSDRDKRHLKIKGNMNSEQLKLALSKATLHDPNQIARISNTLFGVPLPELPEDFCRTLLKIRNDYTHNGGNDNGKAHNLTPALVLRIFGFIMNLVRDYHDVFLKHADVFLNGLDGNQGSLNFVKP